MVKVYGLQASEVAGLLSRGRITVDVVGIGNMGLPLAVAFAKEGAKVVGVRTKKALVDMINRGECPLTGEPQVPELLQQAVKEGRLRATTDGVKAARQADVIILLVPLLVDKYGREDYRVIREAARQAGRGLERGDLVITSTTMPPGATTAIVKPILEEESGLVAGQDFGLAHSPERLMIGRVLRNLYRFPKVVGGIDEKSLEAATGIYSVFGRVVQVSSILAAELVKVAEGTFRDLNIAYANLIAQLCEQLGVDAWEVIAAANEGTNEYCMIHRPGPGVGGHCIPVYPWFLINKAKELGVDAILLRRARHINDSMPRHAVELAIRCLNAQGKPLKGSRVGLLGIAFRADAKETRLAPSLKILEHLRSYQPAAILAHDPYFTPEEIRALGFTPATFEEVLSADCILLVAGHRAYREEAEKLRSALDRLVDTVNLLPEAYWKVGRIPTLKKS